MTDSVTKEIWSPSTGITDLEIDPKELAFSEIPGIKAVWRDQRERLKGTDLIPQFTERLSRELAIETGIIENLYDIDRGVTQTLIDHGFRAEFLTQGSTNRPREFVLQLLNDQKQALEGVFDFVKSERPLSTSFIKALHEAMLRSQTVTQGIDTLNRTIQVPLIKGAWKTQPNFPVRDGVTYKYCPPEQVASGMDKLVESRRTRNTLPSKSRRKCRRLGCTIDSRRFTRSKTATPVWRVRSRLPFWSRTDCSPWSSLAITGRSPSMHSKPPTMANSSHL